MSIYIKLLEIQKQVDKFIKDEKGHNYEYATGHQVLNKIRPLMNQKGLLLKQEILTIKNKPVTYTTKHGEKMEILTSTRQKFTWIDSETGQTDEVLFAANGFNDFDKGLGSALTYAERYFLLKYFHIPTDDLDPDKRQDYNKESVKKKDDNPVVWLNDKQLARALNSDLKTVQKTLDYYDGKTIHHDVEKGIDFKASMKNEYRAQLQAKLKS